MASHSNLEPAAEARIRRTKALTLSVAVVLLAASPVAYALPYLLPAGVARLLNFFLFAAAAYGSFALWPRMTVWLRRRARNSNPRDSGDRSIDPS